MFLSGIGHRREPELVPRKRKYAGYSTFNRGRYSGKSFPQLEGMPLGLTRAAVMAANNSLTSHTWQCYETIKRHVSGCQKTCGIHFSFPFSESNIVVLVAYLLDKGNLKSATINNYLSSIRTWHLTKGYNPVNLRPEVVSVMLAGRANEDDVEAREEENRMPVMLEHLSLLRELLHVETEMPEGQRLAFWCISVLAFFGSFRITEILPKKAKQVDPKFELLRRDITFSERKVGRNKLKFMTVMLKSPKEAKGNRESIRVEIFATGNVYCPVEAFRRYEMFYGQIPSNNAAFRKSINGEGISQAYFNRNLKRFFSPYVSYGTLSGHSFRSGLSSLLGEAGFDDESIKALGRWSSESFRRYTKLGRLKRQRNSEKVTDWVNNYFSVS